MAEADINAGSPVLDALINRASMPPRLFSDAAPARADVEQMLKAAMSAPDHGAVRPWRFHLIEGEARNRLGNLFAEVLLDRDPFATTTAIEKAKARPLRAPLIITVCAKVDPSRASKIPIVEQVVTVGIAMEHLVIAAQAMGYGAIILTGSNAYAGKVRSAFGLDREDELLGFVYIGCADEPAPAKERPDAAEYTSEWNG
ncbi:MAG: nitroreductase [Alphaproteobacteria bacterium]|jgi:nitroreductase|nr:nitroreductase [Alphaproteobacteria bacterium]